MIPTGKCGALLGHQENLIGGFKAPNSFQESTSFAQSMPS